MKKGFLILVMLVVSMAIFSQPIIFDQQLGSRGWATESGAPLLPIEKSFTDAISYTVIFTGVTVSAAMITWIVVTIVEAIEEDGE